MAATNHRMIVPLAILAFVSVLLAIPATTSVAAETPEFMQIIEIDSYNKQAHAGEDMLFNWTIRNIDSTSNLTIEIETTITDVGWSADLSVSSVALEPGDLSTITATVHAPLERGSLDSNLTVVFKVYEDGYLVQISSASAFTEIIGAFASANKVLGYFENPLPSPLDNEWGVFLLDVIIWLAIAFAIAYTMDGVALAMTRRTATMLDDIILGIIRTPALLLVFAYGVVQSLDALHMHIPMEVRDLVLAIYGVIIVIVIFYLAYKLFKQILVYYGKIIAKKTASKIDDVLIPVVEKVGVVVIGIAALGYTLNVLSVDLTMFVAGGVVISMVLAYAAQETISNFFSGIFLLLDRPFAEGDMIILSDGDWCDVRRIGLRTTRLYRFSDATMISIPNNKLVNEKIVRVSNVNDPARVNVDVGVGYGSNPNEVRAAIMKAIEANPYSLLTNPDKMPIILFDSMGDSALVFKVLCWINDNTKRMAARDRLVEEIYLKLNDAGIEIPFPQRVVHLIKGDN